MSTVSVSETPFKSWKHMLPTTQGSPVYVIDDESEVRRSLHFLLSTMGLVSWPFVSAQDFLDNIPTLEPAPILLDIRMPTMDGLQLMSVMRQRGVDWPIIAISGHGDIQVAVKAIKLGAAEFLEKAFQFHELETCLHAAFVQLAELNNISNARNAARATFELLSPREKEIITVLMKGISNKAAANVLNLSVRTVEMHRGNALDKLQVRSIAEVIRLSNTAVRASKITAANGTDLAQ